jgi:two-component system response regulator YesN
LRGEAVYKVFLVDDEIVIREGIRDNVKWQNTGFIFLGEAPDGEMALPLIQETKPDILITDIKMPFMDGLQLSKIIRKTMPWIKIIILSGHDEFEYAREAIKIGVTEYLLKPIASGALIEALDRVALQIEKETKEREDARKIKKQLEQNAFLLRDRFLEELTQGIISTPEIIEGCTRFNINIIAKYYLVAIYQIDRCDNNDISREGSDFLKTQMLIDNIINEAEDIIKFKKSMEEIVLILKGDNATNLSERAYDLGQAIKYDVERSTCYKLSVSIGKVRERLQGVAQSYKDADKVRNSKYIYGKNKILSINDVKSSTMAKKDFTKVEKNNVRDFIKYGSMSQVGLFIEQHLSNLNAIKSPIYIHYLLLDVVLDASAIVNELCGKLEDLVPEVLNLDGIVAEIDSIERFKELLEHIIIKVMEYRESKAENKYGSIIIKAKGFIDTNFSDSNISLNSVAAYVNVSPSHFSTIFSQETGENFIEYLTKVRIKKAMTLLKMTAHRSAEIAYQVGYNDSHYFSYIFKKTVGMTPKEYRNEI